MENPGEDIKTWVLQNATEGQSSCPICSFSDKKYYLASEFSVDHLNNLDVDYVKQELYDLVTSLQKLVVLVYREFSEPDREKSIPMFDFKSSQTGDNTLNTIGNTGLGCGSGRIKWIKQKKVEDNDTCPCPECKKSENPKKEFCLVKIITAAHVVIDDQEAASVTCYIDYNTDDFQGVVKLRGYKTKVFSLEQDRCEFFAVTHDNLYDRFKEDIKRYQTANTCVYDKVNKYHTENENAAPTKTVIIISHPHCSSKRISIGEIKNVKTEKGPKENTIITQYLYDTMTCEGSSGGPVYIVGRKNVWTNHPHSRSYEKLNASGIEWEFETSNLKKLIEHFK